MTVNRWGLAYRSLSLLVLGAIFCSTGVDASAQNRSRTTVGEAITAGTTIAVRTTEDINAKDSDGLLFRGVVDQAVLDRSGRVAIPAGSDVDLIVRETSDRELALDLDAVVVNNQRYSIEADDSITSADQRDGLGANKRTGKYVGGGALLGAVIGAIAGGGKGAAIGAGAGAAAGAGTQVLTRGKSVNVPAESLLTFRLQEPLRTGVVDNRVTRNGRRYRPGYSAATQENVDKTYSPTQGNVDGRSSANVRIGADHNITWQGPRMARIFVQVDNEPRKLFAEGQSGVQAAPWISEGHRYVFILVDPAGNEIDRDTMDLRRGGRR